MFCTIFEIQGPVLVVTFDRLVHCNMEFCHSASLFNICLSERGDSLTICTLLKFLAFVVDLISVRDAAATFAKAYWITLYRLHHDSPTSPSEEMNYQQTCVGE